MGILPHHPVDIVDAPVTGRAGRPPDRAATILEGSYQVEGATVHLVELRQYVERRDDRGTYSLITAMVRAGPHSIEMLYDEGYRGEDALDRAREFLVSQMGVSGLVLRAVMAIRDAAG